VLEYEIKPRVAPRGKSLYGVVLHGVDAHWHRVSGQSFSMDLGNWSSFEKAEAFVQHLKDNGPAHRERDVEYVVVDESLLGYRKPPERDEEFGTVYVLFEPERGLLNNQKAIQSGVNFVRPATPADFEHYRVHLGSHERDLTRPLEALTRNYPVMVAGTLYKPTTPRTAMEYYVARDDDMTHGTAPRIAAWEIWQYLVSGKFTPQLAADAVENLDKLDVFDRASLRNFAEDAKRDPDFTEFLSREAMYHDAMNDAVVQNVPIRRFGMQDMSAALNAFVQNPTLDRPASDRVEPKSTGAMPFNQDGHFDASGEPENTQATVHQESHLE